MITHHALLNCEARANYLKTKNKQGQKCDLVLELELYIILYLLDDNNI